jgi:hypothetical protein
VIARHLRDDLQAALGIDLTCRGMGNTACGGAGDAMHQNKHGEYSEAEGWLYDAVYKRDLSQIVDLLERYPDIQPQRYRHPQVCHRWCWLFFCTLSSCERDGHSVAAPTESLYYTRRVIAVLVSDS